MKNKQPAIRFKGFTEDWEQRELGKFFEERKERSCKGELISITINWGIKKASELGRFDNSSDDKSKYKVVKENDIAYNSMRMWQGASGCSPYNGILSPAYTVIKPLDQVCSLFFAYMFKRIDFIYKFQLNSQGLTSDTWSLKYPLFSKIYARAPIYKEQKIISKFFEQLDNLINLYQSKCDKLINIKKSLLEKMFPKSDSNVPEIRFKGFTEDWEQHKLNVIADVRDGTHDSPQYLPEGHPFVTSKNVKDGYINFDDIQYISDEDFKEINKRSKVDKNDILMGMIGTIGNIALVRKNPDFAIKNVALIKDTGNIYYLYLYHYLQSSNVSAQLAESIDGGTQKFIALNKIRDLTIDVPNEDKQYRIGKYLIQIDNLINLYQHKIEKLQNIKKFCLDKMFV